MKQNILMLRIDETKYVNLRIDETKCIKDKNRLNKI